MVWQTELHNTISGWTTGEAQPVPRPWHSPPPKWSGKLSDWIEAHISLPEGLVNDPGPIKLHKYQREIADCIGDPSIERVTVLKSVRIGYTTLLNSCVAYYMKERPCNILVVVPTSQDSRD
jgi:phage terminase large subunit GpA-like protein